MLPLILAAACAAPAAPPVSALAYRPDGKLLAAGTHGRVVLIDPATGADVGTLLGIPGRVTAVAFAKSGLLAVACGEPGKAGVVRLYDTAMSPAKPAGEVAAHKDAIYGLAFAPDGKTFATAGYDRVIHRWDVPPGPTPRRTLTDHSDAVYAVAFSPDGALLASASADRAVKVWDPATGKRLYTLGDPTDWVYALAWRPDGAALAAAGVDKSLRVWAVGKAEGKLTAAAFAHDRGVVRLAFSPDGKTIYTAGDDRGLKAWDAVKLTETRTFPQQPDAILALAVRPDGKQLAIGRFDGVCQFFDPATGAAGATPVPVKPKPPTVSKVEPDAFPRGRTVRLTITGTRLDEATAVTLPAATAKFVAEGRTPTRAVVEVTVPATVAAGNATLAVTSPAGVSNAVRVAIDRYPVVAETGTADSARSAMAITLNTTVAGNLDRAGDVDYFAFDAAAGQQIGAHVVSPPGIAFDPVLTLTDEAGRTLAEGNRTLGFTVQAAGRYAVGVRDREYRGGAGTTYRLHIGDVPVVTAAFPLGAPRGKEVDVHLDGVNLGGRHGRTIRVKVPADAMIGARIPVPVPAVNGEAPLGDAAVVAGEFPAVVAAADGSADLRAVPGTVDGIASTPSPVGTAKFPAKKGQRLVVEVHARRLGSPLDSTIEVLDAAGKTVERAVLRCTAKTFLTFRDHDNQKPGLRIDAWNELAANDFIFAGTELMRIKQLPGHPDSDCDFVQENGSRVGFLDTTPTHHAHNTPLYKVDLHPPGTTFPPNGMPVFRLHYRNDDGGPGFGKDSRVLFDPPADGMYQVRVADARGASGSDYAYRLTIRPPKPAFEVRATPNAPAVWRGGAVPVTVNVSRIDGFAGEVRVAVEGLPHGYECPPGVVEAGQTSTTLGLFAAAGTTAKAAGAKLVARADIDGKATVREVPFGEITGVAPGNITATTDAAAVTIRPGQETRFRVTVDRRSGFAGRIPVEVRGLPHGVTVQNIGLNAILITEKETSREVVLRAEPWVQPMIVPIVVLAKHEGKNTEHAAKPVTLTVAK